MTCACWSTDERCPMCRDGLFAQLRGSAACRGERWAAELASDPKLRGRAWPTGSPKLLAIARVKVSDLSRDPKLLELLAAELVEWAQRRWATMADAA